jgi:hypothetical protein
MKPFVLTYKLFDVNLKWILLLLSGRSEDHNWRYSEKEIHELYGIIGDLREM